ncbi:site-specific integrase [Azospirillum fermentarium]|uniref:site-specific integrase n=1 Tax=Azospirillum fermentarium TaxID=1233114 RepID=UPI0029CABD9B|nr:site-specific integrase [Azospirillum fermentarium]
MQHVCRRAGTFHFRRRVPGRLQHRLGGLAEVYRSLETSSPRVAAFRSRLLYLESERLFAALDGDPALSVEDARRLMRDIIGPAAWVQSDLIIRRPVGAGVSPLLSVTPAPCPALCQAQATAASAVPTIASPTVAAPVPAPVSGAPLFSTLTEAHISNMLETGAWGSQQTALQARGTFRLWIEYHGDQQADRYTRRHASEFMKALGKLPQLHGRSPHLKGTMCENIEVAAQLSPRSIKRPKLLSMKTIKRHMSALHGYWDWLRQHGHYEFDTNPFSGFDYPIANGKPASEQRAMWSDRDLKRLFTSRLWVGPDADRRSANFWLPIIGLLTGMRLEEIAQLHTADIKKRDGIDFFLVHADGDLRVKNANSVREVPVSGMLVALGFLDLVEERRRAHCKRLWPDLRPKGQDRRLGAYYSERFTVYRREIGVYRPGVDFHSFRGTFETLILNAGANPVFVKSIMGHSTSDLIGEGSRYLKNVTLKNKLEAMNMLKLGVDLGHLMPNV